MGTLRHFSGLPTSDGTRVPSEPRNLAQGPAAAAAAEALSRRSCSCATCCPASRNLRSTASTNFYRRVPIESSTQRDSHGRPKIEGVRLEVDPDQARAVQRIFDCYSIGHSLKRIARDLNEDRVRSPQPQKGRIAQSWCPSSVRHILHNERYRGVIFWGKMQKVRSESGKRINRRKPKSEWRRKEIPAQRIISDELWTAVQQRMQAVLGFDPPCPDTIRKYMVKTRGGTDKSQTKWEEPISGKYRQAERAVPHSNGKAVKLKPTTTIPRGRISRLKSQGARRFAQIAHGQESYQFGACSSC
jgi:hypothetical protein